MLDSATYTYAHDAGPRLGHVRMADVRGARATYVAVTAACAGLHAAHAAAWFGLWTAPVWALALAQAALLLSLAADPAPWRIRPAVTLLRARAVHVPWLVRAACGTVYSTRAFLYHAAALWAPPLLALAMAAAAAAVAVVSRAWGLAALRAAAGLAVFAVGAAATQWLWLLAGVALPRDVALLFTPKA